MRSSCRHRVSSLPHSRQPKSSRAAQNTEAVQQPENHRDHNDYVEDGLNLPSMGMYLLTSQSPIPTIIKTKTTDIRDMGDLSFVRRADERNSSGWTRLSAD